MDRTERIQDDAVEYFTYDMQSPKSVLGELLVKYLNQRDVEGVDPEPLIEMIIQNRKFVACREAMETYPKMTAVNYANEFLKMRDAERIVTFVRAYSAFVREEKNIVGQGPKFDGEYLAEDLQKAEIGELTERGIVLDRLGHIIQSRIRSYNEQAPHRAEAKDEYLDSLKDLRENGIYMFRLTRADLDEYITALENSDWQNNKSLNVFISHHNQLREDLSRRCGGEPYIRRNLHSDFMRRVDLLFTSF